MSLVHPRWGEGGALGKLEVPSIALGFEHAVPCITVGALPCDKNLRKYQNPKTPRWVMKISELKTEARRKLSKSSLCNLLFSVTLSLVRSFVHVFIDALVHSFIYTPTQETLTEYCMLMWWWEQGRGDLKTGVCSLKALSHKGDSHDTSQYTQQMLKWGGEVRSMPGPLFWSPLPPCLQWRSVHHSCCVHLWAQHLFDLDWT